jgi:hypothetical protein
MGTLASLAIALLGLVEGPHQITQSGHAAFEASLAPAGDGFAVAWLDARDGLPAIYSRLLDKRGQPAGPEHRLTTGVDRAHGVQIAAVGRDLAIAWYEAGENRTSRAMLGLWTADGRRIWTKSLVLPERVSKNPVVRARGREIFCAWIAENAARDFELYAAWFDRNGSPIAPAQRLGPAGHATWNVNATLDDRGRAWVAFAASVNTRTSEVYVARVDKSTAVVTRVTRDDGAASTDPDLAVAGDRVALTWFDERDGNKEVYLSVARRDDLEAGLEQRAMRMTNTPGESIGPDVTWNAKRRRFGLAWGDNTEGQHEVYFQAFDANGSPAAPAERLTRNATDSLISEIEPAGDGFALVWNESAPARRDVHGAVAARSEIAFALVR